MIKGKDMLERIFKLKELNTTIKREFIGGSTTFMTMAYIIFVQPAMLSAAGMDFGAVFIATCISSALAIIVMGIYANYPIALAPGMGQNFFFSYVVVISMGIPWQKALGIVFIAGFIFMILSLFGAREKLINAIPDSLKSAIAVGIGFMITLVGLEWSGIIVDDPVLLVKLGDFKVPSTRLALFGLVFISALLVWRITGAMLIGIVGTTLAGLISGIIPYQGIFGKPPSLQPTLFKLDILGALNFDLLAIIITFLILDLFDTIGTLVGIASEAGFLKNGKLPRAEKALFSDAFGTIAGAICGTSTVTSYIESASGVASGARSGLANMFTAAFFILAVFFYPVIKMVGGGVEETGTIILRPTIAPVLILIGIYMIKNVKNILWEDLSEGIPAFMTIVIIAFSFIPTEGIAFGFISYSFLKLIKGEAKKVPFILWIFAIIFLLRYLFFEIK
jgi:AGZA family xanthine/uracil permease-like MFS transporter